MATKKAHPGRPKSAPKTTLPEIRRIIAEPDNPANDLEFMYSEPSVFKCIFNYFHSSKSRDIVMQCTSTKIVFFAKTQSDMSRSMIEIDGNMVTKYFCRSDRVLKIQLDDVLHHFKSIDATTHMVEINQATASPDELMILLHDYNQGKSSDRTFMLNNFVIPHDLFDTEFIVKDLLHTFHVKFNQTAKQFKKTITDLHNYKSMGTSAVLEKTPATHLQFTISHLSQHFKVVYERDEAIGLEQTITGDDFLRVELQTEYMKEFAGTILNDLTIYAKNDSDILFRSIAADEDTTVANTRAITINTVMHQHNYHMKK